MDGVRALIKQRFSVGVLAPVLLGVATSTGRHGEERTGPCDRVSPDWLRELDDYDGADELASALFGELGEVLEARMGKSPGDDPDRGPACRATRTGRAATRARGRRRCPLTMR